MKSKQIILFSLMIIASCAAVFIFAPTVMAKDEKTVLTPMETKFLQETAGSGMALGKMTELAGKKAENKDIKAYAMMLSKEHGKANEDLKMLATKKGVTLPDMIDPKRNATCKKLEAMEGMSFDKAFITEVVNCHEMDIKSFKEISTNAKDPDVKSFADRMLPSLMMHQEKAKDLMPK